ncbi:hypothetical protein SJPD1_1968 [Sulfurospirillum diekertiae]|uniref:Fe/B12 periplasmic-binding domain-containing protein n=1 Tax=Sulfurospirillum diekertiae TaxID=1854492 RepID=A0A290HEX1_9BACT|nr:ABC transporter substrate-binding protein [Sulfurospirillum diekertiae]ATB70073.1 hypothetical protein SJPD1_1968 [Sulfurospirillum diekertiae]
MSIKKIYNEGSWVFPFVAILLASFSLLRPLPVFITPASSHTVIDARGDAAYIDEPFLGAAFTWGTGIGALGFLEATKDPTLLVLAGTEDERKNDQKSILARIYPNFFSQGFRWSSKTYEKGWYTDIEKALAYNPGVYLTSNLGPGELLRKVGLPVLYVGSKENKTWDTYLFSAARVMAAVTEQPQRAEALINNYHDAYRQIDRELQVKTLTNHPRILIMGSSTQDKSHFYIKSYKNEYRIYFPPAGVDNASKGWTGERVETERILAMDPDYIFLMADSKNQTPDTFMHDPRWRGLKAVRDKRVYRMLDGSGGGLLGLVLQPISVRWMAEITHPDRMKSGIREMLRETYIREFNYHLSDQEIDDELHISDNLHSQGYERFLRDYKQGTNKESLQ